MTVKPSRAIILFASIFILSFSFSSFAKQEKPTDISPVVVSPTSCKLMGDKLYNCTPFECDTKMSEDNGQLVHNKISGYDKDGNCISIQSNENGEKVTCKYSEESRKFLGLKMKKSNTDLANMPEASEMDENIMADIFHNECDVISKNADDKPEVNEDEETAIEDDEEDEVQSTPDGPDDGESIEIEDSKKVQDNGDLLDTK